MSASPWTKGLSAAVRRVFVQLHKEGLLYRDKRLVNWHPGLQTAVSDLEVENVETQGSMWRFRYPLADGATYQHPLVAAEEGSASTFETRDYIVVATTRPETMLGRHRRRRASGPTRATPPSWASSCACRSPTG